MRLTDHHFAGLSFGNKWRGWRRVSLVVERSNDEANKLTNGKLTSSCALLLCIGSQGRFLAGQCRSNLLTFLDMSVLQHFPVPLPAVLDIQPRQSPKDKKVR